MPLGHSTTIFLVFNIHNEIEERITWKSNSGITVHWFKKMLLIFNTEFNSLYDLVCIQIRKKVSFDSSDMKINVLLKSAMMHDAKFGNIQTFSDITTLLIKVQENFSCIVLLWCLYNMYKWPFLTFLIWKKYYNEINITHTQLCDLYKKKLFTYVCLH